MNREELTRELSRAKILLIRKEFAEAEQVYRKILKDDFDNLEANVGLLKCHSKNYQEFNHKDIDADIDVIKSLFPHYDDEYFVSYVNLKKRGQQTVELSTTAKLRLAEEAMEKRRQEIDTYLGFIPEETLEFFPWYSDLDELKEEAYQKIKKHEGEKVKVAPFWKEYMSCIKEYNEKGDFSQTQFYTFYYQHTEFTFDEDEWEVKLAMLLNDYLKGVGTLEFIINIITSPIHVGDKAYIARLKRYDMDHYLKLVLKYLKLDAEDFEMKGPAEREPQSWFERRLNERKEKIQEWEAKLNQ